MITYRFTKEQLEDGSYVQRPKVLVTLKGPKTSMDFFALLDSGTDITILPRSIADFLGVKYDLRSKKSFYGFGKEPFPCVQGHVDVTFKGKAPRQSERITKVPVLVELSGGEQEPVLGCEKIFDVLKITFIQRHKIQITKPAENLW